MRALIIDYETTGRDKDQIPSIPEDDPIQLAALIVESRLEGTSVKFTSIIASEWFFFPREESVKVGEYHCGLQTLANKYGLGIADGCCSLETVKADLKNQLKKCEAYLRSSPADKAKMTKCFTDKNCIEDRFTDKLLREQGVSDWQVCCELQDLCNEYRPTALIGYNLFGMDLPQLRRMHRRAGFESDYFENMMFVDPMVDLAKYSSIIKTFVGPRVSAPVMKRPRMQRPSSPYPKDLSLVEFYIDKERKVYAKIEDLSILKFIEEYQSKFVLRLGNCGQLDYDLKGDGKMFSFFVQKYDFADDGSFMTKIAAHIELSSDLFQPNPVIVSEPMFPNEYLWAYNSNPDCHNRWLGTVSFVSKFAHRFNKQDFWLDFFGCSTNDAAHNACADVEALRQLIEKSGLYTAYFQFNAHKLLLDDKVKKIKKNQTVKFLYRDQQIEGRFSTWAKTGAGAGAFGLCLKDDSTTYKFSLISELEACADSTEIKSRKLDPRFSIPPRYAVVPSDTEQEPEEWCWKLDK